MRRNTSSTIAFLANFLGLANALNPIVVESQNFVDSVSGDRFEILGVDYQPGGSSGFLPSAGIDPLSNATQCLRDAAMMQAIGYNTIRTYNVDPLLNHDECVSIFNYVGIYLLIDVNSPLPGQSISQTDPSSTYNAKYLKRVFQVIDAFSSYPNVIGFFSANELINSWPTANEDATYIRAVTRDMKQYIAKNPKRKLPVGYSAADFRPSLVDQANYVQCVIPGAPDSRSDFFALNSYSWCGNDTFITSTYNVLARDFASVTMPTFFSEYGCIVPSPRYFTEVPVIYGPKMVALSGGLVYEWTEEGNGYGLVNIKSDGSVQTTIDLYYFIQEFDTLNTKFLTHQNATARHLKPPTCSANLVSHGPWTAGFDLPSAPSGTSELIANGAGGRVGKIIKVTQTAVQVVVTSASGGKTTGLTITAMTTANLPGKFKSIDTSSSSTSPTSQPSTSNNKSGASGLAKSASGSPGLYIGFFIVSFTLWLLA